MIRTLVVLAQVCKSAFVVRVGMLLWVVDIGVRLSIWLPLYFLADAQKPAGRAAVDSQDSLS
jgi:hypothetical protein